jgi:hypothetical protein
MSAKHRAFALAVATAALVGMSAPAYAATFQDGPSTSGFNNDSVLNLSGNQLPVQTCTSGAPINTATETQTVTGALANLLPTLGTGDVSPSQGNTCTQTTTETNTFTANTGPTTAVSEDAHSHGHMSRSEESDPSSDPSTSGFNNDSVLNLSGNQLPVQTCTSGAAVNTVTETQALTGALNLVPVVTTGAVSPMQGNTCTQSSTETNSTTANTGS